MKNKSASLLALVYCGLHLPAAASGSDTWEDLSNAFDPTLVDIGSFILHNDISAPANSWLSNSRLDMQFDLNGYTLTGCGGTDTVIWNNEDCKLTVSGGHILSNGSTQSSIVNWGTLKLADNACLDNGVLQSHEKAEIIFLSGITTLSGANNITAGKFAFITGSSSVFFSGGLIDTGVYLSISGPGEDTEDALYISGGVVNLNGSGAISSIDNWEGLAEIGLSATGTLILNDFQHDDVLGAYNQSGGTLNLTHNSSILDRNPITTNGSGSGLTTVNIGSTASADTSSLTMGTGCHVATAATGDTLAVNVGSPSSTGNSLNISGGTLNASASVALFAGNSLNLSSGTAA